jgi:hypothetical protein
VRAGGELKDLAGMPRLWLALLWALLLGMPIGVAGGVEGLLACT